MKFVISIVILVFMIGLPLSTLKYNYYVLKTYNVGIGCKSNIIKKSYNGYSSRTNYYVYVDRNSQQIKIRVPFNICNKKRLGDSIEYKFMEGNDFGVYEEGLHPFNFIFNLLILISGIIFLYHAIKKL